MSEQNPYAAPETDPVLVMPSTGSLALATPSERFFGAFMDGLVGLAVAIPVWVVFYFLGVFRSFEEMGRIGFGFTLLLTVIHFPIYMAIQWKFLKATGQSIGKKLAKTRVATMEGRKPEINDLVFKRYAFVTGISLVPVVGSVLSLVDVLLVFKSDRRCLHDMVAGTQVVKFPPGEVIP
ncbi:MAG: RDD family protein [Verrucomicrobiaceae bacterium]|nr:MAG: RDD family protein [Verrucomicrobiaceae bacterium]